MTAEARRVMITAFGPFDGRDHNTSELTARALSQNFQRDGVEYSVCILPVVYDQAAAAAQRCYEEMNPKPEMVVSTGEYSPFGCRIAMETRAMNMDDSEGADETGAVRSERTIDRNRTPYQLMTLPYAEMSCGAESDVSGNIRQYASTRMSYVCNNTAYRLSNYFGPRNVPYGFLHLPRHERCGNNTTPDDIAGRVHRMVRAGLAAIPETPGEVPCDVVNLEAINQLAARTTDAARALCLRRFAQEASTIYSPPTRIEDDGKGPVTPEPGSQDGPQSSSPPKSAPRTP